MLIHSWVDHDKFTLHGILVCDVMNLDQKQLEALMQTVANSSAIGLDSVGYGEVRRVDDSAYVVLHLIREAVKDLQNVFITKDIDNLYLFLNRFNVKGQLVYTGAHYGLVVAEPIPKSLAEEYYMYYRALPINSLRVITENAMELINLKGE